MSEPKPARPPEPEDIEEVIDVSAYFEDLGEGPEPRGRPEDYPGVEIQTVLRAYGPLTAGKQYRPDHSGERRAVKVSDYKLGKQFVSSYAVISGLGDLFILLQDISTDRTAFLVRGMPYEEVGRRMRRKLPPRERVELINRRMGEHHDDGAFEDIPRQLQMLDLDGVRLPIEMSVIDDPKACVIWAVDNLLPPEFRDVSFVYQFSSSAGLSKADNQLNVHLWFFTERPYWNAELRSWALWWNAKQRNKIIDHTLFNPVQPHYTNDPTLLDGLVDPLAGRRLGSVRLRRQTVPLRMPSNEELVAEGRLKVKRARQIVSRRAAKGDASDQPSGLPEDTQTEPAEQPNYDEEGSFTRGGTAGAVRVSPGWHGYLELVGHEGSIRDQIRAAIGSYFYEYGSRGDRRILKAAIETAIKESPYLDSDEPNSRPRKDAFNYLDAPPGGISNVDEMIRDFAASQTRKEKRAEEECDPAWSQPTLTLDEAFDEIDKSISRAVCGALELRMDRLRIIDPAARMFLEPPARTAVLCEPGVGKTAAMIKSVCAFLALDPGARVAIAVPTHHLGHGLAERVNEEFGAPVAAEWYGADHSDPQHPDEKMCRLADAAGALRRAGGDISLLCSSKHDGHCPHHPTVAGTDGCGYQRQQLPANRNTVRVWVVPAVMLENAPLSALHRPGATFPCDFDLLVIDEAPWPGLLEGHGETPKGVPVEWLAPVWWQGRALRGNEDDKTFAIETLAKIYEVLAGHPLGEVTADTLIDAGITAADVKRTRRFVWRCKAELRALVQPGAIESDLARALSKVAPINKRVAAVAEALQVVRTLLQDQLAPSGFELIEQDGRFLRLRWRKEIHPAWLEAPVVYLDAAGTGGQYLAKAWLPDIEIAVEARATSPNMRITQITDSQMSYDRVCPREADEERVIKGAEEFERVIEPLGEHGLVVCPKKLGDAWEKRNRPPGWTVWHFNAIRGRDEASDTRHLVVISRPLPPPAEVELVAETIFGRRVQRLGGEFYPKQAVGRLMDDGTGRRALPYRHPDQMVEAVRFAGCEGELIQAIGRGRGVRRNAETPLDVLVLTNVPVPLPVKVLTTWKELSDAAGPIALLAARGVLPLGYEGIARALPGWLSDGAAATEWFRGRPDALDHLRAIRDRAKRGGTFAASEFLGNPYKSITIGNSQKLVAYRYRQGGNRQSNLVLVDPVMHRDARAAVEAVLGAVDTFEPVIPSSVVGSAADLGEPPTTAEHLGPHLSKSDHGEGRVRRLDAPDEPPSVHLPADAQSVHINGAERV